MYCICGSWYIVDIVSYVQNISISENIIVYTNRSYDEQPKACNSQAVCELLMSVNRPSLYCKVLVMTACVCSQGLAYFITDVPELHDWMKSHFTQHPLFEEVSQQEMVNQKNHSTNIIAIIIFIIIISINFIIIIDIITFILIIIVITTIITNCSRLKDNCLVCFRTMM